MRLHIWEAALLAALPLLSGCVAAAIPVLAAGGVLRSQTSGGGSSPKGEPRVSIDISEPIPATDAPGGTPPARSYTLPDGTRMEVMTGPVGAAPTTVTAAEPAISASTDGPASGRTFTLADGTRAEIIGGSLPAPGGTARGSGTAATYDPFYSFAESKGTMPIVGSERRSAMLAAPGTLAPETKDCSIYPAAVLIDLDPGPGVLDPAAVSYADPSLAGALAALRAQDIAIAWISANTADRAGAVRRALRASGLDPDGRDELVLLRYPEERKQTRREDFAKSFCIVAIAGDARGDFDELFQFLKDPALAAPLEPLIGNGWFLIPQPLS